MAYLAQLRPAYESGIAGTSAPSAPLNVSAVSGSGRITIIYDESAGASSYNIYWSTTSPVSTADTKIVGVSRPYAHTGLVDSITQYYAIEAVGTYGTSGLSSEITGTTLTSSGTTLTGTIQLETGWQLISIPAKFGSWDGTAMVASGIAKFKEYILDQLITNYSGGTGDGSNIIERASTRIGGTGTWYDFIPGLTGSGDAGNFVLMFEDTDVSSFEPVGILLKSIHSTTMNINWTAWQSEA